MLHGELTWRRSHLRPNKLLLQTYLLMCIPGLAFTIQSVPTAKQTGLTSPGQMAVPVECSYYIPLLLLSLCPLLLSLSFFLLLSDIRLDSVSRSPARLSPPPSEGEAQGE